MSSKQNRPVVVVACAVFQHLVEKHLPDGVAANVTFLDYGLHTVPKNLQKTVQATISAIAEPSLVVLGYGLCGNGLNNIQAGAHTLLIPRTDDCIAILLGSYEKYIQEFTEHSGTYYLTKGWLESGSDPLREYEKYLEQYDEETAVWLIDQQYQHYKYLTFVAHNQEDLDAYRPRALEVAKFCERWGMTYSEMTGSEAYVQRLMAGVTQLPKDSDEFLVVPPGGTLQQSQFLRMDF
ncbi:MAG: DUF1638 domain-containing protein [Ardenticatenaceae bacterium]|nr:DUF1638 domain-containing protein [Ardenticatenaceae bacterium]